ncbi:MAG: hypothetical protein GX220_05525 [Treponema sp.]|nr:hypothetical protein [Treponema sp.]
MAETNPLDNTLRFQIWALIDEVPSLQIKHDKTKQQYQFSVDRIKTLAPFVLEGMIYGWKFTYTPYDKRRNINEFFEFECIKSFEKEINMIQYEKPYLKDGKMLCWIRFDRTEQMMHWRASWNSINNPKISGVGQGNLTDGFEGVENAYAEALKNAVRTYAQGLTRNKPKEITGTVFLYNIPKLLIRSGKYEAHLDFFLTIDKIVPYKFF